MNEIFLDHLVRIDRPTIFTSLLLRPKVEERASSAATIIVVRGSWTSISLIAAAENWFTPIIVIPENFRKHFTFISPKPPSYAPLGPPIQEIGDYFGVKRVCVKESSTVAINPALSPTVADSCAASALLRP